MSPANVPIELVVTVELALGTKCVARPMGSRCDCPTDEQLRTAIAATLTHLEQEENYEPPPATVLGEAADDIDLSWPGGCVSCQANANANAEAWLRLRAKAYRAGEDA